MIYIYIDIYTYYIYILYYIYIYIFINYILICDTYNIIYVYVIYVIYLCILYVYVIYLIYIYVHTSDISCPRFCRSQIKNDRKGIGKTISAGTRGGYVSSDLVAGLYTQSNSM